MSLYCISILPPPLTLVYLPGRTRFQTSPLICQIPTTPSRPTVADPESGLLSGFDSKDGTRREFRVGSVETCTRLLFRMKGVGGPLGPNLERYR